MKTWSKVLYEKKYTSSRGIVSGEPFEAYIKFVMHFDFKEWLRFSCSVSNLSVCQRNPFRVLFRVIEHENVGNIKYQILKDEVRRQDLHRSL